MANKQFIRHLEFYGYPDQNGYSSEASCCDCVDLSEIIKKNKQQDQEIECLTHEKAEKKDLDALSATVETVISAQSEINLAFADSISGLSDDVEALKEADAQFAEQLSAMTEDINEVTSGLSDAMCGIQLLGKEIDDLKDTLESDYAKKDEVVTRDWIEEQGYLTVESGDSRYAKIEDLENLADIVESATTGINDEIDEINEKLDEFSGEVITEIEEINEKIDELQEEVSANTEDIAELQEEVSANTEDIAELQEKVSANTEDIEELQEEVSANTEDIAELQEEVSAITDDLSDLHEQVDANTEDIAILQEQVSANTEAIEQLEEDLAETRTELLGKIDELDEKKADKTDLAFVSGAVDDLSDKLDAEIERSSGVDETMQAEIESLSGDVADLSNKVDTFDGRITDLEDGLAQEIEDRKQADLDLIGNSGDPREADTIWGAKNFAQEMKRQAVSEAEVYTDEAVEAFSTELATMKDEIEQELTAYATTAYVESRITETKTELEGDYNQKIEAETERATGRENAIVDSVDEIRLEIISAIEEIAHNATIIHAITEWDGSDPEEYVDTGNGILDVLHREFHEYVKEHINGDIKSITYEDGYLIIVYESTEGERTVEIPFSDIVDLSDYYKKEETDALLDEKADKDDVSGMTEAIEAEEERAISAETSLEEKIIALRQALESEIDRAIDTESVLTDAIEAEEARATSAETSLSDRIAALRQSLNEEIERATAKETELEGMDIVSGNIASDATISVTKNNGDIITFNSAEQIDLEAGEF